SPSAAGAEDSDWSSEGAASDVGDVDGPEEQAPSTSADAAPRAAMLTARLRDHFIAYPLWWRGYAPTLERSANIAPFSQEWERLRSRFGDERISRPGAIFRASSTGSRATSTHRAGTWSDACDQGVHAPQHARRGQLGGVDRALAHDAQDGLGARLERHELLVHGRVRVDLVHQKGQIAHERARAHSHLVPAGHRRRLGHVPRGVVRHVAILGEQVERRRPALEVE